MASIEKRPDGKYRARWREYPGGPQKTKHFDRKGDADRFLVDVQHQLFSDTYVDPNEARRVLLGDYGQRWMEMQPWRPSTRDRNESLFRRHVRPAFGDRPIGSLRSSELQAWATGLSKNLKPATVEGVVRFLRSLLNAAVDDRLIARSPAGGIRLAGEAGSMLVPLSVADVRSLAAAAPDELVAPLLVAAATGLRQGELFGLTEDRVAWLRRELVVDRQLLTPSTGPPLLGPCKTARSVRTVPLADSTVKVLARHVERFGVAEGGFMFHRNGRPLRRNRAADAFRATTAAAGVTARGWHDLRHHAASVLIAQGLGVTAVAATLGHSPAECLRTYAGWWPSEGDAIRAAVERAWAEPGAPLAPVLSQSSEGQ